MDKRFLGILAALAILFVGIFAFTSRSANDEPSNGGTNTAQATNHTIGEGQKGVTLLEYGDFQCSACFAYEPAIKQIREKYARDIKFQFRHLPLTQIHPNAFAAGRAVEAAGMQGKFWEMHDMLYDPANWQSWTSARDARSLFEGYAQQLSLDVEKFKQDFASDKANDAINADINAFEKTGQDMSTPTFFINGRYVPNSELSDTNGPSVDKISKLIEDELAKRQ